MWGLSAATHPCTAPCTCSYRCLSIGLSSGYCRALGSRSPWRTSSPSLLLAPTSGLHSSSMMSHSTRLSCKAHEAASAGKLQAQGADMAIGFGIEIDSSSSRGMSSSTTEQSAVQFEICKIPGDGSCLFRALAQGNTQLDTGSLLSEMALLRAGFDLRRDVCNEMTHRREEIEPFITGIFDAYVEAMAREGIWGGEPELAVAIHCLQRPVVVYRQVRTSLFGEKSLEKVSVYGAEEYPGVSPICVLFSGAHYDTLLQVSATV